MLYLGYPISTGNGTLCCKERDPLLLTYVISFFRCIWKAEGSSDSIYKSLVVHITPFCRGCLSNCMQTARFGSLSARETMGWYTTMRLKCFMTFVRCIMQVNGLSNSIYKPLMCQNCAISIKIGSQLAYKMLDLGCPQWLESEMQWYKEGHPLLLEWFITLISCLSEIEWASNSI